LLCQETLFILSASELGAGFARRVRFGWGSANFTMAGDGEQWARGFFRLEVGYPHNLDSN